jgi:hypothetical protein
MSQQGRVLGIGGIFFKSANQQQLQEGTEDSSASRIAAMVSCCRGVKRTILTRSRGFAWIYDPDGNKIELWQPLNPGN